MTSRTSRPIGKLNERDIEVPPPRRRPAPPGLRRLPTHKPAPQPSVHSGCAMTSSRRSDQLRACLPLCIGKIGRDGDHRLGHFLSKVFFAAVFNACRIIAEICGGVNTCAFKRDRFTGAHLRLIERTVSSGSTSTGSKRGVRQASVLRAKDHYDGHNIIFADRQNDRLPLSDHADR